MWFGLTLCLVWRLCSCGVISDKQHEQKDRFTPLVSSVSLSSVTSQKVSVQMDRSHLCSEECFLCHPDISLTPRTLGMSGPWGYSPFTPLSDFLDPHWWLWPTQAMCRLSLQTRQQRSEAVSFKIKQCTLSCLLQVQGTALAWINIKVVKPVNNLAISDLSPQMKQSDSQRQICWVSKMKMQHLKRISNEAVEFVNM